MAYERYALDNGLQLGDDYLHWVTVRCEPQEYFVFRSLIGREIRLRERRGEIVAIDACEACNAGAVQVAWSDGATATTCRDDLVVPDDPAAAVRIELRA